MVHGCTIIARNYMAHARALADSFFSHHRDGSFTVLLIDDESREFDGSREVFECLRLNEIGLDSTEVEQLVAIYDVTELATAVKPPFLRHLLRPPRSEVIYLDPDIRIYGSLEEASRLAREHSVVLTPHMTAPLPRDGRRIDDFHILSSGVYNLGFIAVGPGSDEFINWWWQKTRREALVDHSRMMFTDQRWVDFVPSFFNHFILKDPTYNVAYWNLHTRDLTWNDGAYLVNGRPLTFFHFSGFDVRKPHLLSKHQGDRPRILLSESPAVARICREYIDRLEQAGLSRESAIPYGWKMLAGGIPFDRRMRRLYREGIERHEKGLGPSPPGPFDKGAEPLFMEWLNEPVAGGLRPRVSRYLNAVYQDRPDLQQHFPDLAGDDCRRFFYWLRTDGVTQEQIPSQLLPPENAVLDATDLGYAAVGGLAQGVNIAGYFRAELGIGEAARLLTSAVDAAGIPHSTVAYDATASRKAHPYMERGDGSAPYDTNIVCVNADRTPDFVKDAGRGFFTGRYTIGYWFWELENFPPFMHAGFDCVDEVWTASRFVASGIRAVGRRPVYTVPLPVQVPRCSPNVTRASLRLPPGFMFLFIFDFFSIVERKNPTGVIKAFARAFRPGEGPILVIKTINGDWKLNDLEKVRAVAAERPDILIIDKYYSAEEKSSLLGLCDCYVSLHRSEGFGLTMAEAMSLGKPVVATGYSGNLDFMTPENSYLVDYVRGTVPPGCEPYTEGSPWAEPSLDQAAEYMRRVYESQQEAARKGELAREDILTRHNVQTVGVVLKQRLDEIQASRQRVAAGAPARRTEVDFRPVADPVSEPILPSLDGILPLLTPTPSVAPGRPLRRLLLLAQELLFKILRPYWWQQRHVNTMLTEALRSVAQTAAQAAKSEPHQRQALESVWTAVRALEQTRAGLEQTVQELQTRLQLADEARAGDLELLLSTHRVNAERLERQQAEILDLAAGVEQTVQGLQKRQQLDDARTVTLEQQFRDLGRELNQAQVRLREADGRAGSQQESLNSLGDSVTTFQKSAAAHLSALAGQLAATTEQTTTLSERLYAVPYMDDPGRFHYTDGQGRKVLGFRSPRATQDGVYAGFEDIFRGSESFIRDRFHAYLPLLRNHERVVDIGCGRGELLDVLRGAGISAVGVDIDEAMVKRCLAKGLTVELLDGVAYLSRQRDDSVPAIVAAQVVEHLSYKELLTFLELARTKLKAGGQLIFETVNPHALEAFKTFWTDPTHHSPIFPEVAIALSWLHGFDQAYVFFPNGTGDLELDRMTQGEYAVVVTKARQD